MRVAFESLPDSAKVWVYQSSAKLSNDQQAVVHQFADAFLGQWESHGIQVQGSIDLLNDLFIRVAAFTDEPSMCGRAQDAQVRLMKELESELNVELTNRMLLTFQLAGNNHVVHMNDVPELIAAGDIDRNTPFFNNLIQSKKEFQEEWNTVASDSWIERYF